MISSSSGLGDPELAAFAAQLETRAQGQNEKRQQALSGYPGDAIEWLALTPGWTIARARAAGFPSGPWRPEELFARMVSEGVVETRAAAQLGDDSELTLVPTVRELVLSGLRKRSALRAVLARIGRALTAVAHAPPDTDAAAAELPGPLRRWADLSRFAEDPERVVKEFHQRISAIIPASNGATVGGNVDVQAPVPDAALAAATRWTETAALLQPLLGEQVATAVVKAERWVQLAQRRTEDAGRLARFLARADQVKSFEALMASADGAWALHFVGPGGVGKTMLARHISAVLVPGAGAVCARIDFDHINPDYPYVAPWLLLDLLADQLRLYELSTTYFHELDKHLLHVKEVAADTPPGEQTQALRAAFTETMQWFIRALKSLERPVVLILDTCEELAKVRPDGDLPSNVKRTFELLEQMHQQQPNLRVVFCGRRPLARSGAGWRCEPSAPAALPDRPYLRLHEVRGFTEAEASAFVGSARFRDAVLARAREVAAPRRFVWERAVDAPADGPRYNPYELAFGLKWVRTEQDIGRDPHEYTRVRIVDRAGPDVRLLLPAMALLRRADAVALRGAWRLRDEDERFETAVAELARQEWVVASGGWIEIEPAIQRRLVDLYASGPTQDWRTLRTNLTVHLLRITREADPAHAPVEHFEACLRLLVEAKEFARAEAWWRDVESRHVMYGRHDRLEALCSRLLADDQPLDLPSGADPAHEPRAPLRAALTASYAAALCHVSPQIDGTTMWQEVERLGGARPELRDRAIAGQVASIGKSGSAPPPALLAQFGSLLQNVAHAPDPQKLGACVAALEALIEDAELRGDASRLPPARAVAALLDAIPDHDATGPLRPFVATLLARQHLLRSDRESASPMFARALEEVRQIGGGVHHFADWCPPEDVRARVLLEYLRAADPRRAAAVDTTAVVLERVTIEGQRPVEFISADGVSRLVGGAWLSPDSVSIDADRAGSALLALRLRADGARDIEPPNEPPDSSEAPPYGRRCNAHDAVAPLCVTHAALLVQRGDVDRGLSLLTQGTRAMESVAGSMRGAQHADRLAARTILRMRLYERAYFRSLMESSIPGASDEDTLDRWAAVGLSTVLNPATAAWTTGMHLRSADDRLAETPLGVHARWRAVSAWDEAMAGAALGWALPALARALAPVEGPVAAAGRKLLATITGKPDAPEVSGAAPLSGCLVAQLVLDVAEATHLAVAFGHIDGRSLDEVALALLAIEGRPGTSEEEAALRFRRWALAVPAAGPVDALMADSKRDLGACRAAEVACEEGQLLALRLPEQAAPLLAAAATMARNTDAGLIRFIAPVSHALALTKQQALTPGMVDAILRPAYESWGERDRALPDWGKMRSLAGVRSPDFDDARQTHAIQSGQGPWILRLAACLAAEHPRSENFLEWVERLEVRNGNWQEGPPSEMAAIAFVMQRRRGAERQSQEIREVVMKELHSTAARGGAFGGSVGMDANPSEATSGAVELQIRAQPETDGYRISVVPLPHSVPSEFQGSDIPTLLRDVFSNASAAQPSPGESGLVLKLDGSSCAVPWERYIADALRPNESRWICRELIVSRPQRSFRGDHRVLSWTASRSDREFLTSLWQAPEGQQHVWQVEHRQGAFAQVLASKQPDVGAAHLIAAALPTARGVRLRGAAAERSRGEKIASRGELTASLDILEALPSLAFCLLQSPPAFVERRSYAEGHEAALLREFASELGAAGIATLVIPPLDPGLLREALAPVVAAIAGRLPLSQLAAATAQVARILTRSVSPEAAGDVCLYVGSSAMGNIR